jgi:ribosomal protein S18 acetylase RimI-like enzyme
MNHQPSLPNEAESPANPSPTEWTFARARELEGTLHDGPEVGVWQITLNRILKGWGGFLLRQRIRQLPPIPEGITPSEYDHVAKDERIAFYYRVWNSADVLKADVRNHGVSACFRVTERWRNAPEGCLDFEQRQESVLGGHSLAVGPPLFWMPRPKDWGGDDYFVRANSWGQEWGNRGFYAMTYDFFNREMYDAWALAHRTQESQSPPKLYGSGIQHVKWSPGTDNDRQFLVYDIVDVDHDNLLAWAIATIHRGIYSIEELYVKPEARRLGYGSALVDGCLEDAATKRLPIEFLISFADVDRDESVNILKSFFGKRGLGFEPSRYTSAAFCVVPNGKLELPAFEIPPKPTYYFRNQQTESVAWSRLQDQHNVSDEFIGQAKAVFARHSEVLRRLA